MRLHGQYACHLGMPWQQRPEIRFLPLCVGWVVPEATSGGGNCHRTEQTLFQCYTFWSLCFAKTVTNQACDQG